MYSEYSLKRWWCHEADEYANVYMLYVYMYMFVYSVGEAYMASRGVMK